LSFKGLDKEQTELLSHGDSINRIADCFRTTARSSSLITSIANDKMYLYDVHLNPEVELSPRDKMLHNLLVGIAGHAGNYTLHDGNHSVCNISEIL